MSERHRSVSGFSALELLLVAAVGAIVAVMAVPSLQSVQEGLRLQTAGISMASKVAEARTNALKRNRWTWILCDATTRTAQVQTISNGTMLNVGAREFLPRGVTFKLDGAPTTMITFDSMGRPLIAPQTLVLQHTRSGYMRTITVASTGRISVK